MAKPKDEAKALEKRLVAIADAPLTKTSIAEYRRLYPLWLEARDPSQGSLSV